MWFCNLASPGQKGSGGSLPRVSSEVFAPPGGPREWAYRYDFRRTAPPVDETGYPLSPSIYDGQLRLWAFPVLRHTRCGFWIRFESRDRFINRSWTKQFAYLDVSDARRSFAARKQREIRIHQARIRDAEWALKRIEEEAGSPQVSPTKLVLE